VARSPRPTVCPVEPGGRALRTVQATRYVTPLREGGSLPAIVEADDGTYVLKFRGAGQGAKALVAEIIAGEIGRKLGLPVPDLVLAELDVVIGRSEPDPEIQALIKASAGLNLAMDFLPGAFAYDAAAGPRPDPALAADIVWFDAFVTNIDRTARNTNMLLWHKRLWLIDHGAALYFHHAWGDYHARASDPFRGVRDHVLLSAAGSLADANARQRSKLGRGRFAEILAEVPDEWLVVDSPFPSAEASRQAYVDYLTERLDQSETFVEEAERARAQFV
jgi:hypothetical protein